MFVCPRSISSRAVTRVASDATAASLEAHGRTGCVKESLAVDLMARRSDVNHIRFNRVSITLTEPECLVAAEDRHRSASTNA